MGTKEKLTEIIGNVVVNDKGNRIRDVFHPEFVEKIAVNLIENGAEIPVRCKECRYFIKTKKGDESNIWFCQGCGDTKEACGRCVMYGFCAAEDGYCYKGEKIEEAERALKGGEKDA